MSVQLAISRKRAATTEPELVRRLLIGTAFAFLVTFVCAPLAVVFVNAFREGAGKYLAAIREPDSVSAIQLTLLTAVIVVPLNLVFGLAAAWAIAKFRLRARNLLVSLIDLPFSVSPVIAGLLFVLLFGRQGFLGPWLSAHDIRVIFAPPGIVLAPLFVTLPLVAREVLAVMEAQGSAEEEAALSLGASGWQTYFRVTLPKIKWGVLYGVVLCNARSMGEFGAVSVVSGHIRGVTTPLPLQGGVTHKQYELSGAFAVASLLTLLALVTLLTKKYVETRSNGP